MTKEENPQNQERGFPSFLESANSALPTFPPHDYYCCTRFTAQAKQQNHDCATRYLPDLPTDSSEEAGKFVMSLKEVSPELLAELFHRYHQVLAPGFGSNSGANDENWQHISEQEKNRLITAVHLALTELRAEVKRQEDRSRYFAKPGEAEWGC